MSLIKSIQTYFETICFSHRNSCHNQSMSLKFFKNSDHVHICFISRILISTRCKYLRPNFCQGVVLHFFYFKVPNVRMYLLNPFLKLVRWKKCRKMPWQKSLFFIYIFFILQSTFGWNTCDMWISHDIFDRGTSTCTFAQSQISRKIQRWVFSSVYRYENLHLFNFNV